MATTVFFTSGKGGTGKSTLCALCGRALAEAGGRALLLELDSGLRCADLMLGVSSEVVFDIEDLLCGRCKPVEAITPVPVSTPGGALHLMAGSPNRLWLPGSAALSRILRGLGPYYDLILIDGGAGVGPLLESCAPLCDIAVLTALCEPVCLRDAQTVHLVLRELGAKSVRLAVNRFTTRQLGSELPDLDAVIDRVGAQLIAVIPEDRAVARAVSTGTSLEAYQLAADPIRRLTFRLLGQYQPLSQAIC